MSVRRTGARRAQTSVLPPDQPGYARVLRLRHLRPSGPVCFALFEGMAAFGTLLALAELTSWWAVPVLPVAVAAMVKFNDTLAGLLADPAALLPGCPALAATPASVVAVVPVPALLAGPRSVGNQIGEEAPATPRPRPRPGTGATSPVFPSASPPAPQPRTPRPRGAAAVPASSRADPDAPPPRVERQVSRDPGEAMDDVRSRQQQSRQSAALRYDSRRRC